MQGLCPEKFHYVAPDGKTYFPEYSTSPCLVKTYIPKDPASPFLMKSYLPKSRFPVGPSEK
jgi:hypothetical protein